MKTDKVTILKQDDSLKIKLIKRNETYLVTFEESPMYILASGREEDLAEIEDIYSNCINNPKFLSSLLKYKRIK